MCLYGFHMNRIDSNFVFDCCLALVCVFKVNIVDNKPQCAEGHNENWKIGGFKDTIKRNPKIRDQDCVEMKSLSAPVETIGITQSLKKSQSSNRLFRNFLKKFQFCETSAKIFCPFVNLASSLLSYILTFCHWQKVLT